MNLKRLVSLTVYSLIAKEFQSRGAAVEKVHSLSHVRSQGTIYWLPVAG